MVLLSNQLEHDNLPQRVTLHKRNIDQKKQKISSIPDTLKGDLFHLQDEIIPDHSEVLESTAR